MLPLIRMMGKKEAHKIVLSSRSTLFRMLDSQNLLQFFFTQSLPIDITIVNICDHFDTVVDLLDATSVLDGGEKGSSQD